MKNRILAAALALAVSPFVFAAGKQAPDTTSPSTNPPAKTKAKHKKAPKTKKPKKNAEQK